MARDPFVWNEDKIRKMECIVKCILNELTQNIRLIYIYTSYKSFLISIFKIPICSPINQIHSNSKETLKSSHPPSLSPFRTLLYIFSKKKKTIIRIQQISGEPRTKFSYSNRTTYSSIHFFSNSSLPARNSS